MCGDSEMDCGEEWCAWDDPGEGKRVVIPTDRRLLMAGLFFPGGGQVFG